MTTSRTMQSLVQMYLDERHSAVFALEIPGKLLMGFARFSDQRGHRGPITEQLTLASGSRLRKTGHSIHLGPPAANDPAFR